MSLKKIGLSDERRAEPDDNELQETRQGLKPVARPEESLLRHYDERFGVPISDLHAIEKESTQLRERYARESPVEVVKKSKSSPSVDLEQQLEELEKIGTERRAERKPRPKSESYERNVVVDLSQPQQPETVALRRVLPYREYATHVNSGRAAEPEVRAVVNNRVENAPPTNPYGQDRGRPARTQEPARPKSTYAYAPKPFNAGSAYSDLSLDHGPRRGSEPPPRPGQPVTYNFRLSRPEREPDPRPTTYRTKSSERDRPREDGQNVVTRCVTNARQNGALSG